MLLSMRSEKPFFFFFVGKKMLDCLFMILSSACNLIIANNQNDKTKKEKENLKYLEMKEL